jgi:hypothetical protein
LEAAKEVGGFIPALQNSNISITPIIRCRKITYIFDVINLIDALSIINTPFSRLYEKHALKFNKIANSF